MFRCHFGWIWLSAPVGAAVWLFSEVISRRRAIYLVQRSSVILLFELSVCNCFSASPAVSLMKSCLLSLIAEWILHQGERGESVLYFPYFFLGKEPWEKFFTKKALNWQFPFKHSKTAPLCNASDPVQTKTFIYTQHITIANLLCNSRHLQKICRVLGVNMEMNSVKRGCVLLHCGFIQNNYFWSDRIDRLLLKKLVQKD